MVAVYPSHYEGFGLPVLEAQALGTPVICSDNSALLEVANSNCLFFQSEDTACLAGHLQRSIEDAAWRQRCSTQGRVRAAEFTWDKCVASTLSIYEKALNA